VLGSDWNRAEVAGLTVTGPLALRPHLAAGVPFLAVALMTTLVSAPASMHLSVPIG